MFASTPISESEFDLCILTLQPGNMGNPLVTVPELPKQCNICYMKNYI